MKIAFPSDDGQTISAHFGRATHYVVVDIDGDADWDIRDKAHHGSEHVHPNDHGSLHQSMFAPLADCQVLVAGGMGEPAYESALANGQEVILTGEASIRQALDSYRRGELVSDLGRVHSHGGHGGHAQS